MAEREIRTPSSLKADIWKYFGFYEVEGGNELDKSHTICRLCRTKLKYFGNTKNMRNHITRFHPEEEKQMAGPSVAANQRTIEQTILSKLPPGSERAKRITKSIATFIAKDLRPYSVVENQGFCAMLHTLEPRYNVPSRRYFTDTAIPKLYNETKNEVMESLKKAGRIAVTCDAWTSIATESYVTVTAHFITDEWQLASHVLQTREVNESHTGANIAELLKNVTEEWQITKKDLVLVTDNASNMAVAAELCKFLHVKCYAHTLNLASQRALKLPTVSRLLGRVRRITTYFHRSTTAKHQFEEKQILLGLPKHKLKIDVSTRWNSAYEMVDRFLEQQPAVCAALLSPQVRRGESDICTLTEADISNAEDIIKALKPMKDATVLMSEESSPSICLIAPLQAQLIQDSSGESESSMVREIKHAISGDLSKRYKSEQERNTLLTASALDPRFKGLPFLSVEEREMYGRLIAEAASLEQEVRVEEEETPEHNTLREEDTLTTEEEHHQSPSNKRKSSSSLLENLLGNTFTDARVQQQPMSAYARAEKEVTNYRSAPSLPLSEDPLSWWTKHARPMSSYSEDVPLLKRLGVNVGGAYHSRERGIRAKLQSADFWGLLFDGSEDITKTEQEIVYIVSVSSNGEFTSDFIGLIELGADRTAQAITDGLVSLFQDIGLEQRWSKKNCCTEKAV
ncbi:E3 SUMO-protein ligase ZBED1-like [Paramisgurnus dabryanus]|uniref:E3 SUMO-protein ligase ZBED1-like n=1 Tax=Paramisgurnus dabryanus TaxID=90735 RepID=UPI003CCF0A3A